MSRPGAPERCEEADLGLQRTGGSLDAKLLHSPNILLGPVRACALLVRNEDPWQHRSPLHEMRFVLGALLGTNWRRELLGRVLLSWLWYRPDAQTSMDDADQEQHCMLGFVSRAKLLHNPDISLGPIQACALLARNGRPGQHRSPLHEQRFVLGALLGTNWRRELLGKVLLAWLLLCPRVEGERHPANMHPT